MRCTGHLGTRGVFLVLPSPQPAYTTNHNRISKDVVGGWMFRGWGVREKGLFPFKKVSLRKINICFHGEHTYIQHLAPSIQISSRPVVHHLCSSRDSSSLFPIIIMASSKNFHSHHPPKSTKCSGKDLKHVVLKPKSLLHQTPEWRQLIGIRYAGAGTECF